jgi:hypothetical protein
MTEKPAVNPNAQTIADMKRNLKTAFLRHRLLMAAGLAYVAAVLGQVLYCRVPMVEFIHVITITYSLFTKSVMLLGVMGLVYYARCFFRPREKGLGLSERLKQATERLEKTTDKYFSAEVFAHGCMGLVVLAEAMMFFFQKSLIPVLNPYHWDPLLSGADKALHFGHFPHDLISPFIKDLHLQGVLEDSYLLWFIMMYGALAFNLFWDRDLKRRMQFLWTFFLTWVICGSAMALAFSSVGPVFFHNFYPLLADPYHDLVSYFNAQGKTVFPLVYNTRDLLMEWATNGKIVNPNAISAMPSMHVAIAWLAVLYTRRIGRKTFLLALAFWASIMLGSVFFGFHYAVDDYVSVLTVSLIWRAAGRGLERRYPADRKWDLQIV